MTINLLDYPMDMEIFTDYPKCRHQWVNVGGDSGCLLTAFWASLGFDLRDYYSSKSLLNCYLTHKGVELLGNLKYATGRLIDEYDLEKKVRNLASIYTPYDQGNFELAIDRLWVLIERHPKKTNNTKAKEQVLKQVCSL